MISIDIIQRKMNLLIVANDLSKGGIQTALMNLLKEISKDKRYNIDLFIFSDNSNTINEVPKNVKIIKGNYFLKLSSTAFKDIIKTRNIIKIAIRIMLMILVRIIKSDKYYKMIFALNRNEKEYDYAISYFNDIPNSYFNRGATDYVLDFARAAKKVGWIHTDIEKAKFDIKYYEKKYERFDYIINVSEHCRNTYNRLLPKQAKKTRVIYNFFPIDEIYKKSKEEQNIIKKNKKYLNLITVARIDNISKRIDRVINVANKLVEKKKDNFHWYIIGDGPNFLEMKEKIKKNKLEKNVVMLGMIENPYPYIKASDVFVLTSDFEGYPMVIGESLILNTPVVVTNYDSASEQIENGYNGFIVGMRENEILSKLEEILEDPLIIGKLEHNIKNRKLTNDVAKSQFEKIFGGTDEKKVFR